MIDTKIVNERREDLIRLVEDADITYSMYKNAVEKYTALINLFGDNDLKAHIYPQGSFAIGTVVKPLRKNKDADYDLDVICEVNWSKSTNIASSLYEKIKSILENDANYKNKLTFFDECIRVNYAEIGGYKFSIDVVPAVPEDSASILKMKSYSQRPDLCDTAIAITKLDNSLLGWGTSNPKGYETWFGEINQKFYNYDYGKNTNRSRLFEMNRTIFATSDEIPPQIIRTPLQRVIQLLKLHKNAYFSNPNIKDYAVKSVIISTIVANSATFAPEYYNTFELLNFVLKDLEGYSDLRENHVLFQLHHPSKQIIKYNGREWFIENPSNPMDNLANSWNEDDNNAKFFFMWIKSAIKDFGSLLGEHNFEYGSVVRKMFGEQKLKDFGYDKKYNLVPPTPIKVESQNKPWLEYGY